MLKLSVKNINREHSGSVYKLHTSNALSATYYYYYN